MPDRKSIIVLGSANTDLVIQTSRLPAPGETVLGGQFYQAAGGKGANQAVAACRAGGQNVVFVAAVGDDTFGRAAVDGYQREQMNCQFIKTVAQSATGVALIMVDHAGENCISVALGANYQLLPEDIDQIPAAVFQQANVLLACLESPLATVARGIQRAREAGLNTILNPAPADRDLLDARLLPLVDVLTPNATEATALTGIKVNGAESAAAAGQALLRLGCRAVVVTLGNRGAVLVSDGVHHVPAISVTATDATAAGDAFNGALAVALTEHKSLAAAVRFANVAAGLAVTRRGAQPSLPQRREIDDQLDLRSEPAHPPK